ncbi:MAG: O-antigen ligase family protein [Ruminococcus flavefaciens]|nr:O-antigen ligase family protein [Ruminococcus flavefaciens]
MAFLGLGKILWIGLFFVFYQQLDESKRAHFFRGIPWIGVFETAIGVIGYLIPIVKEKLWVNERLGGTFQYPNTFALFLLVGILILLHEERLDWKKLSGFLMLCVGIGASGSRIVMVLSIAIIFLLILQKRRWRLGAVMAVLGVFAAVYILFMQDTASIGRILRISFKESTFVGRLLYARDALPLLFHHPFGMGYLGYYYMENGIQTGVYTVRYVHNDWLQMGLDIGWIPMVLYLLVIVRGMWSKRLSPCKKWILVVIFLHGILDYDLAFTVMLCLVVIILDDVPWREDKGCFIIPFGRHRKAVYALAIVHMLLGIYLFIPGAAEYREDYRLTAWMYPWHTEANLHLLSESEDIAEVERLAKNILKQNDTCALAYYGLAFSAYCRDDYESVIRYQREAIARDYFNYEEYWSYALMLHDGILLSDDENIQNQCREELINLPSMLEAAKGRVSFLGSHIVDQPELEIDEELQRMIEGIL